VVGKSDNGDPERAVQGRSCRRRSIAFPMFDPIAIRWYALPHIDGNRPGVSANYLQVTIRQFLA